MKWKRAPRNVLVCVLSINTQGVRAYCSSTCSPAVLPTVLQSYLQFYLQSCSPTCSPAVLPTESYSTYSNGGGLDFPDEERLAIACPTSSANSNLSGVLN